MKKQNKKLLIIGAIIILAIIGYIFIFNTNRPTNIVNSGGCNNGDDTTCTQILCENSNGIWDNNYHCTQTSCLGQCSCRGTCRWTPQAGGCECLVYAQGK